MRQKQFKFDMTVHYPSGFENLGQAAFWYMVGTHWEILTASILSIFCQGSIDNAKDHQRQTLSIVWRDLSLKLCVGYVPCKSFDEWFLSQSRDSSVNITPDQLPKDDCLDIARSIAGWSCWSSGFLLPHLIKVRSCLGVTITFCVLDTFFLWWFKDLQTILCMWAQSND